MTFRIDATTLTGTLTSVATDDPREALQSLLAFEAAKFQPVFAYDADGRVLLQSDLLELAKSSERADAP